MPITTLYQFSFNSVAFGGAGSVYQIQSIDGSGKKKTQQSGWFQVHPAVIQ
jgi:hypothetical protein